MSGLTSSGPMALVRGANSRRLTPSAHQGRTMRMLPGVVLSLGLVPLTVEGQVPTRPKVLPEAEEAALALEALPAVMRQEAGVWILGQGGYRELRPTQNGYTCIVNRDHALAIKPTCFDPEGTATILPVNAYFGNQLLRGRSVADIQRDIAARFASGEFKSPSRAGIAFMLSPNIVNVVDPAKGTLGTAPPHYMIYAPNVTNADLSISNEAYNEHMWLPYAAYTGPQGYIIVTVPDADAEAAHQAKFHQAPSPKGKKPS